MKGFDQTFREEAQKVRATPSASAWKRIESRLETTRARRSAHRSRLLGYAAGLILLIGLTIGGLYMLNQPELIQRGAYSASITDLEAPATSGQSIYSVEKARALSSVMIAYGHDSQ
ncbi:MAG: hypothetical protein R3301_11770 [Saprospiraceae bacterium]|nr:hypothetical protein [Saprospiraceae bacterium]